MENIPQQPSEDDVLAQAFKIIDHSGTLVPGSRQYNTIRDMIQGWIDQCGLEKALDMARTGAKHLGGWRKFLLFFSGGLQILWTEQGLHRMRCQLNARNLTDYGILASAHNR